MKYQRYNRRKKTRGFGFFSGRSVVFWLIAINILVSAIAFILFARDESYIALFALKPSSILAGQYLWTLVVHMFAHGGFGHLFINMFVLFSLGGLCERIIGQKRFIWFYLVSGLFAGILSVVLAGFFGFGFGERVFGSPEVFMVGASGAIFAIAGLYVMLLPKLKFMIIFLPFFSLPAYVMIPGVLFLVWGLSIWFGWPVGNVAHFGGFLAGIGYGWYLKNKYKQKVTRLQRHFR
ncbi:hypothetical protein CMI47_20960 [Candidatus Pacearchaeota archaeon]|nr:hypothetical protein [Candidatus Pacearchaeota archaeon]